MFNACRVTADLGYESRWVMPYQREASVTLFNTADEPVRVQIRATTRAWDWDERSMHFHAVSNDSGLIRASVPQNLNMAELQERTRCP